MDLNNNWKFEIGIIFLLFVIFLSLNYFVEEKQDEIININEYLIEDNYSVDNFESDFILDKMKNHSDEVLVLNNLSDELIEAELVEKNQVFIDLTNSSDVEN